MKFLQWKILGLIPDAEAFSTVYYWPNSLNFKYFVKKILACLRECVYGKTFTLKKSFWSFLTQKNSFNLYQQWIEVFSQPQYPVRLAVALGLLLQQKSRHSLMKRSSLVTQRFFSEWIHIQEAPTIQNKLPPSFQRKLFMILCPIRLNQQCSTVGPTIKSFHKKFFCYLCTLKFTLWY